MRPSSVSQAPPCTLREARAAALSPLSKPTARLIVSLTPPVPPPVSMVDVGKSKAEVAAERVMQRVAGLTVTPHFCRIEDKPPEWYQDFHIIVLGLDSLEVRFARRSPT